MLSSFLKNGFCKNKKGRDYYKENKEKFNKANKRWRIENPERYKQIAENYKERQAVLRKVRYEKNRAEENLKSKEYYNLNRETEHYRKTKQKYKKERKNKDPLFNLRVKIASRVYTAFKSKSYSKNTITEKMIGCSWKKLKQHIN